MSLEPTDDELFGLALGELPPERAAVLEAWRRGAPEREARFAEVAALVGVLAAPGPSVDLTGAIDARIDRRLVRRRRARQLGVTLMLAAMVCLLVWSRLSDDDSTRIKGGALTPEKWAGVELYRVEGEAKPAPVTNHLRSSESLLIAYRNGGPQPFSRLLVYGVTAAGELVWYYPAWQRAEDDPEAISIDPSERAVELHESIRHELPRGRLVVHAVFARRAIRVSEIERMAAQADPLAPLPLPGTAQQQFVVEVR